MKACHVRHLVIVLALLCGAGTFFARDSKDRAACLELAQQKKHSELLQRYHALLPKNLTPLFKEVEDSNNLVALAAIMDDVEVVRALHEQGIDINKSDETGRTPLAWTVIRKNDDTCGLLFEILKEAVELEEFEACAHGMLVLSIQLDNPKSAYRALEALTPPGWSPLAWAVSKRMHQALGVILSDTTMRRGWGTDLHGSTPLSLCVINNMPDIAQTLLDAGADPTQKEPWGESPLSDAVGRGNRKLVIMFAAAAARLASSPIPYASALHWAAHEGDQKIVTILLAEGFSPSELDTLGNTPLHIACQQKHSELIPILVKGGASIHTQNNQGLSPLDICAQSAHGDCLTAIAYVGGAESSDHPFGWTPLIMAARRGNLKAVQSLLQADVPVDQVDHEENTPLYWAARFGHLPVVERLVLAGADVNHANSHGWNTLFWACKNHHAPVVRYLLDHGARSDGLEQHALFLRYAQATLAIKQMITQLVSRRTYDAA